MCYKSSLKQCDLLQAPPFLHSNLRVSCNYIYTIQKLLVLCKRDPSSKAAQNHHLELFVSKLLQT